VAKATPFDVVLIDMEMPGMDGGTLARAMRTTLVPCPRIVLLTRSAAGGRQAAAVVGADAAVSKPVRESQLYDVLATLFGGGNKEEHSVETARSGPKPTRGRVLLAEDNPVNQRVAQLFLEQMGFAVDVVGDGDAAVRAVGARRYDAVLMDCEMPGTDGYDAAREIRRQEGAGHRVPIMALTASATVADRDRALAAGMDEHVAKPIDREHFSEVLARLVRPRAADEPVLDVDVLDGLRELAGAKPRAFFGELRELLSQEVIEQLSSLRTAVAAGRPDDVAAGAHRLKGTGGYLGAQKLVDLCTRLETLTKESDCLDEDVQPTVDEVERVLHELIAAVEEEERQLED
jgi:two-component system sensor histidine kinase/response regulator